MFKKHCPHCDNLISMNKLNHVPRTEKLRWYQITPAPRTACPECGGFVTSTTTNSKFVAFVLAVPIVLGLSSIYVLEVREFFKQIPGGFATLMVIFIPFVALIGFRAKLTKDKS